MKIVRKLVLSVIALICVSVCFAASTYAWFDINSRAQVSGFDFQAMSGEGFLVSVDGVNYSNDLTSKQMKMAMIQGYKSDKYQIINDELYDVSSGTNILVDDDTIDEILTETILLYPVTSKDGINFTNLVGSSISNTSGKYIQFSIYFKATSSDADDNFTYDIFLSGKDIKTPDGKTVTKTSIKSVEVNTIPLLDKMVLYNGTDEGLVIGPDTAQNFINVYTSNALRFSVQDTTPVVEEPEEDESQPADPSTPETQEENTELETQNPQAIIYELTNDDDLGSYATDYNGDDADLNKLYNSKFNAGFTYYNSQRDYAQINAIKFEDKPTTIRTLDDELVLATVSSGSEEKMLTFRFWLEGWDADCFDGLSKSINVKLLFNSKKVK